jgi:formylglycine-generating enzyme
MPERLYSGLQYRSRSDHDVNFFSCDHPDVLQDDTGDAPLEMVWIRVDEGNFVFGSNEDAPDRAAYAEEQSKVTLTRSFQMAQMEVTQYQWQQMGLALPPQFNEGDNLPVTFVNFYEAAVYCNALSKKEGLDECYNLSSCVGKFASGGKIETPDRAKVVCTEDLKCEVDDMYYCTEEIHKYDDWYACPGYRIPTSAEWEYAARAGTTTHTYNGDLLPNPQNGCEEQPNLLDIAWYCYNSEDQVHPVGKKRKNPWGFYDILGNVLEWTDYFTDGESLDYNDGHSGEDLVDPLGKKIGAWKDIRGGSWTKDGAQTRSGEQFAADETYRRKDTGLRPVRTLFE